VKPATPSTSATCVNLGFALSERLRELAAEHGRDFVAEARAAVRAYLETHAQTTAARSDR
jgi:plasmid stability protein